MLSDPRNVNTQFRALDWKHIGLRDGTTLEKKRSDSTRIEVREFCGLLEVTVRNFKFMCSHLKLIEGSRGRRTILVPRMGKITKIPLLRVKFKKI